MSTKEFVARNGLIANTSASVIEGSNTYFVANSGGTTVGNVKITNTNITVGNSTVNAVVNSTVVIIGGGVTANSSAVAVGSNVVLSTVSLLTGNSTVNAVSNSLVTTFANSTQTSSFGTGGANVGANVSLTSSLLSVGNSTVNTVVNSISTVIGATVVNTSVVAVGANVVLDSAKASFGNSTVNTVVNSIALVTGTTVVNSTVVLVGTVTVNTSAVSVGNSTVNTVVTQTGIVAGAAVLNNSTIAIGNSTVNTSITPASVRINGVQLLPAIVDIGIVIGDGTNVITTGSTGRYIGPFDFGGTIQQWSIIGQESGNVSIDVWKCTYSQFDAGATHPVAADKISASAPITLSSATKNQSSTLTGWTTTFSAGDIFAFNVSAAAVCKQVTILFKVSKTS